MELLLAQNHSAMAHLPIASAIFCAAAALIALFIPRKEVALFWAVLTITALATALPTVATGIAAGKGRINEEGKPYIERGVIVSKIPQDTRVYRHQMLGIAGTILAVFMTVLAVGTLRGRKLNKYVVAVLSVLLALLWGIGGHEGGKDLWGPDTFPGFQRSHHESGYKGRRVINPVIAGFER